jgi:hypothetical protein
MNPVTGLSLGRIAIGALAIASPPLATRLFRLDGTANPQLPYLLRMFGSREVALGAVTLMAPAAVRRNVVAAGIAVDLADAVAGVMAARDGSVTRPTGAFLTAPAIGAAAAGVAAWRS